MTKAQIDTWCGEYAARELIEKLSEAVEDEYDEYAMLKLSDAYVGSGNVKEAKKTLRKIQRLFPEGEYAEEAKKRILSLTEGENVSFAPAALPETEPEPDLLKKRSEKKQRQIPKSIQECFKDTVGMKETADQLSEFYNMLYLQNERSKKDFQAKIVNTTHFLVVGDRGSGKTMMGQIIARMLYNFGIRSDADPVIIEGRQILSNYDRSGDKGIESMFEFWEDDWEDKTVIVENLQDVLLERKSPPPPIRQIALCLEKIMNERKESLSVILTGDLKAKTAFFNADVTLEDALYDVIEIPSYSPDALLAIADKLAEAKALRIHVRAREDLKHRLSLECRNKDFMNAITVRRYLEDATKRMADRLANKTELSESDVVYLMPEDFRTEIEEENLEELLAKLNSLTGLASMKKQIQTRINAVRISNQVRTAGISRDTDDSSLHMLFLGAPGTGKTTVARLVGKIYQSLGVLPRGDKMVECGRSDLVGEYVGQTARLVQKKVKEAYGGILFIDEAYALCRGKDDSFGKEAVDELIRAIENNRDNMMVILAGYTDEMEEFLNTNPGFRSRIRNRILFEDYTVPEMIEIFKGMVKDKKLRLENGTEELLHQLLERQSKAPDFGNARGVRNILENVVEEQERRLSRQFAEDQKIPGSEYSLIRREDLQAIAGSSEEKEKDLQQLLAELNSLTGLASVKKRVQELVADVQVKKLRKSKGWGDTEGHGSLHLVFKGNAGTGKTTVARLIGQIYKELGVLRKNVFIETGRKDLVGRYLGQTAPQTMKKIGEAEGGILFIDEAYNLINGENDTFGMEAVNTLLAEMENRRDSLMVIIAGYAGEMDRFLDANQGLASRFANEVIFEDYTPDELYEIFVYMAKEKQIGIASGIENEIRNLILERKETQKDFGNARGVRNIVEALIRKMNMRIAKMLEAGKEPSLEDVQTIIREDIDAYRNDYIL